MTITQVADFFDHVTEVTGDKKVAFLMADIMVDRVKDYLIIQARDCLDDGIKDEYGFLQALANGSLKLEDKLNLILFDIIETWYEDFLETIKDVYVDPNGEEGGG